MFVLLAIALVVFAGVSPTPSASEPFRLVTDQWVPYENLSDATAPGFSTEVHSLGVILLAPRSEKFLFERQLSSRLIS
jgi:hypothetical protein